MVEENPLNWEEEPPENFLNINYLYRGVKKVLWSTWPDLKKIYPNFFTIEQTIGGLSVDWSKYCSPESTLNHLPIPDLKIYGIVQLNVGNLRECINQNNFLIGIKHKPIRVESERLKINRGHTLLTNFSKEGKSRIRTKVRVELSKIANWSAKMHPILEYNEDFNHYYI